MAVKAASQISIIDVTDAYSVTLTSEAYTFVGNTAGAPSGLSCTTQAVAYCGTKVCKLIIGTIACPIGITASISNNNTVSPTITFKTTATITAACEAIIPITIDNVIITKKFSFAVAKTGATGASGKGIKSTTITYQAGASGKTAPTGTWVTSPPETTAVLPYMWTRTIITYTDNTTSTSYSVGATPEGIQVGGRNLAQKTSSKYDAGFSKFDGNDNVCFSIGNTLTDGLSVGDVISIKLICKYTNIVSVSGKTPQVRIVGAGNVTGWNDNGYFPVNNYTKLSGSNGEVTIMYQAIINANHVKNSYWNTLLRTDAIQSGIIQCKMFKVERGTKCTDWSPAPEDTDAKIENITIGGRNLIQTTNLTVGWIDSTGAMRYTADWDKTFLTGEYISVEAGKEYMFQLFWTDENTEAWIVYAYYDPNKGFLNVVPNQVYTSEKYYCEKIVIPEDAAYIRVSWQFGAQRAVKLEKGNKATDFTQAPEDMESKLALKIDQSTLKSAIEAIADTINITSRGGLNLTGNSFSVSSTNFTLTKSGAMWCKSATIENTSIKNCTITGGKINITSDTSGDSVVTLKFNGYNNFETCDTLLYAGGMQFIGYGTDATRKNVTGQTEILSSYVLVETYNIGHDSSEYYKNGYSGILPCIQVRHNIEEGFKVFSDGHVICKSIDVKSIDTSTIYHSSLKMNAGFATYLTNPVSFRWTGTYMEVYVDNVHVGNLFE